MILLPNHSEIMVDGKTLRSREIGGPFRWTFRRKIDLIRRIVVLKSGTLQNAGNANSQAAAALPKSLAAGLSALTVVGSFKRKMLVAPGYPREMLVGLATALAAHCKQVDPTSVLGAGAAASGATNAGPEVAIEPDSADADPSGDPTPEVVPMQPAHSKIILVQDATTATFAIPRPGFKSPYLFLIFFGLIWCALTGASTLAALMGNMHDKHGGKPPLLIIIPFLGVFWAVGLGLLLGGIAAVIGKSVIIASPDFLLWSKAGLFGKKERQWDRGQVAAIRVGDSNTEINHRRLQQLQFQVYAKAGDPKSHTIGLLTGRDRAELEWMTAVLRQTLGVGRD